MNYHIGKTINKTFSNRHEQKIAFEQKIKTKYDVGKNFKIIKLTPYYPIGKCYLAVINIFEKIQQNIISY